MELHFKYLSKLTAVDEKIEKERHVSDAHRDVSIAEGCVVRLQKRNSAIVFWFQNIRVYGGEVDDDQEEQFYLQRLEAGLFTLQLVDYIMLETCQCGPSSVRPSGSFHCLSRLIDVYVMLLLGQLNLDRQTKPLHLTRCLLAVSFFLKIRERVMQILNMRGGSIKTIRMIMRGKYWVVTIHHFSGTLSSFPLS